MTPRATPDDGRAPFFVVIPARYASTRLPGKPLRELNGKALVHHVYDVAQKSGAKGVVVATDDARIETYCNEHGLGVAMTRESHQSGTDRCAEVAAARGWPDDAVVVNLQGDEPLVPPQYLALAADHVAGSDLATLAAPMNAEDWHDTNRVKVVCDANGRALYFSRAPIPWHRDAATAPPPVAPLHHVGIYAYRVSTLARLTALAPTDLERTESLEQLRALYHGMSIRVATVDALPGPGVDTPEDLDRVSRRLAMQGSNT